MSDFIPLIVLVGYLVFLVAVGVVGYLRSKVGEEDYYLAGRQQGWLVSSLTIMATFFSSWALLGAAGMVYSQGLVFALFALNVPLAGACVYLFGRGISKIGRRNGYVTPGDMIADYYGGHAIRILTAVACALYVIPYVVMQIQAGGLLFHAFVEKRLIGFWDNYEVGCVLLCIITTIYTVVGGMRSVAWTDVVQGILLVIGMLLGGYVTVHVLGGPTGFFESVSQLPDRWLTAPGATGRWPIMLLFTVVVFGSIGSMVTPAQWMRYYAARSVQTLRRSAIIFALVLTACFLFGVMLVGIGGQALYPSEVKKIQKDGKEVVQIVHHERVKGKPDTILACVLQDKSKEIFGTLGIWLASIIIMAIAAGSMSTADSNLHALSAVLTRDVYDRYVRPRAGPEERTWVGRGIIVVAALIAIVLVFSAHRVAPESTLAQSVKMIVMIGIAAISFSLQLLPATIDMLWIRKGSSLGATLGLAVGLAVTAYVWQYNPLAGLAVGDFAIKIMDGVWGLIANVAVFVLISLVTKPPAKAAEYADELKA